MEEEQHGAEVCEGQSDCLRFCHSALKGVCACEMRSEADSVYERVLVHILDHVLFFFLRERERDTSRRLSLTYPLISADSPVR